MRKAYLDNFFKLGNFSPEVGSDKIYHLNFIKEYTENIIP